MNKNKYALEKYKSRENRYTCPQCGQPRCFTRYVDLSTGNYVHDTVGKCDHVQSCGYHKTPAEFNRTRFDWERDVKPIRKYVPPPKPKPVYIPMEYVTRSTDGADKTAFFQWCMSLPQIEWESLFDVSVRYFIGKSSGATPAVVFWQIDRYGNVHDGKLMWYNEDGHRTSAMTWVSYKMKKAGLYPDQATDKCLFGEHLLSVDRDSVVCLVESEKTAVICACLYGDYIWVATCGCGNLKIEQVRCLAGRRVAIFPDSGVSEKWRNVAESAGTFRFAIADWIERYPPNTDLVDILIDNRQPLQGEPIDVKTELDRMNFQFQQ